MTTIAGVRIHPGFFNRPQRQVEHRVADGPSFKTKRTVTKRPASPRAKYAMPVVAVVAAIASVVVNSAAIAAVAAGTFTAASVIGTIAAVGAVAGAVGVVTGNERLTKIGGVMALVGGLGNLAIESGLIDGGASFSGGSGAASAAKAAPIGDLGTENLASVSTAVDPASIATSVPGADVASGMVGDVSQASPLTTTPSEVPGGMVPSANVANPTTTLPSTATPTTTITDPTLQPSTPVGQVSPIDVGGQPLQSANTSVNVPNVSADGKIIPSRLNLGDSLGKFGTWMEKNQLLASSILKGIEGAAQNSSMAGLREAQINSMNANAAREKQLTANMSGVGGSIDWTKYFNFGNTKGGGMISAAGKTVG